MFTTLAVFYVCVCIFLILVVLLQAGKGGGMGAAFGGTTQTVFGGAGAGDFLTRLTAISAALFMILSATLSYMSSGRGESALEKAAKATQVTPKKTAPAKAADTQKAGAKATQPQAAPAPMSVPENEGTKAGTKPELPDAKRAMPAETPATK